MSQHSTARARWTGSTLEGSGVVSTDSPAIDAAPLAWKARVGEEAGTTPEELLAAGWAGCFCMALSFALSNDGHTPKTLETEVTMAFGPKDGGGFSISGAAIHVHGSVPGIDDETFVRYAEGAKVGCPVSAAFAGNLEVTLEAHLGAHA